jgi:hypothetical protein
MRPFHIISFKRSETMEKGFRLPPEGVSEWSNGTMSKYMQIDIKLLPFYEKRFKTHFPKLAKLLQNLPYTEPLEKEMSLYALVDVLQRILRDPKTPHDVKWKVDPHLRKLLPLKDEARELLLGRRLNALDKLLYQIEDEFEELEKGL